MSPLADVTAYDSAAAAMPASAPYCFAYVDGAKTWGNLAAVRARCPGAVVRGITTTGASVAAVCDVESGDASPATAAVWVRRGLGRIVYSSLATKPELDVALAGLSWDWFAADPTGWPHMVVGAVATQYAWASLRQTSGGDWDLSLCSPSIFGVTPWVPPATKGKNMIAATPTGNGYWTVTHDGAVDAFGDAQYHGGAFAEPYLQPGVQIVGIAGHGVSGYWLYASDGSIFSYGSAPFLGRPDRF